MDNKRELTNELIAESLKELTQTMPFEKITIRMITEKAGVIRPTFYYHFQDKYETLEWIVGKQLLKGIDMLLACGMFDEAAKMIFIRLWEEKEFYSKAFAITGQNGFINIFIGEVYKLLAARIGDAVRQYEKDVPLLDNSMVAKYFSVNLVVFASDWMLGKKSEISAEEMADAYIYLLRHTYLELFGKE